LNVLNNFYVQELAELAIARISHRDSVCMSVHLSQPS